MVVAKSCSAVLSYQRWKCFIFWGSRQKKKQVVSMNYAEMDFIEGILLLYFPSRVHQSHMYTVS